jgi:uncharacterized protein
MLHITADFPKSFFLFGPRGTGKTSWVKAHFGDGIYIDLLYGESYRYLQANSSRLDELIPNNFQGWVIIDEVQKLPELLDEVHRLIEEKKYRFILTGSSARKLKRRGVNLLAGRALQYAMHPMTAVELGKDFDLVRALQFGQLPAIEKEPDAKKYLAAYVQTYLREEVMQEGLARNLTAFTHFLECASFSQGSPINAASIAREVGVDQKTIVNYFDLTEDLLIANRLPVFTKRAKRKLIAHPKFYFFDVGVYRTLRPKGPLDNHSESMGICFESLFLQEARAINDYCQLDYDIYYWRTQSGREVDFVFYGERGLIAVEAKSSSYIENKDLGGLRAFQQDYPMAKCYMIYGGKMHRYQHDISIIPMSEALMNLPRILAIEDY